MRFYEVRIVSMVVRVTSSPEKLTLRIMLIMSFMNWAVTLS